MGFKMSKQRLYACLLILGACILLFRTIMMVSDGSLGVLVLWVSVLLVLEMLIDTGWLVSATVWLISGEKTKASVTLKLAAAAITLHAIRVLIFVMGRVGPWVNFDIRPEQRLLHYTRWTWSGVYFAAIMSVLGVLGVIVVWRIRRRARKGERLGN
ncbi:MAG: hypothetical protein JSV53_03895 [candidate division WOR-3 bacterium]|nr:MAG: hypothetical protein JSV53_03895 [candidate division WOR-3 bacterium]